MGIALHGWHRLHATGHLVHGHRFAIWTAGLAVLLLGALLWLAGTIQTGDTAQSGTWAPEFPIGDETQARVCARALMWAETKFATDPTPVNRLQVARCVWQLAWALPPDESEHCRALLDRAARLLDDPLLIGHLTPDDLRMKATIRVLCAPLLDLPSEPVNGRISTVRRKSGSAI